MTGISITIPSTITNLTKLSVHPSFTRPTSLHTTSAAMPNQRNRTRSLFVVTSRWAAPDSTFGFDNMFFYGLYGLVFSHHHPPPWVFIFILQVNGRPEWTWDVILKRKVFFCSFFLWFPSLVFFLSFCVRPLLRTPAAWTLLSWKKRQLRLRRRAGSFRMTRGDWDKLVEIAPVSRGGPWYMRGLSRCLSFSLLLSRCLADLSPGISFGAAPLRLTWLSRVAPRPWTARGRTIREERSGWRKLGNNRRWNSARGACCRRQKNDLFCVSGLTDETPRAFLHFYGRLCVGIFLVAQKKGQKQDKNSKEKVCGVGNFQGIVRL